MKQKQKKRNKKEKVLVFLVKKKKKEKGFKGLFFIVDLSDMINVKLK